MAGGLVGGNQGSGYIKESYATGNVESKGRIQWAGGFVGYSESASVIENCYSTGKVAGTENKYNNIGGFGGYIHSGRIINCYSKAVSVSGNGTSSNNVGMFVGFFGNPKYYSSIEKSFVMRIKPPTKASTKDIGAPYSNGKLQYQDNIDLESIKTESITATTFTDARWSRSVWKNLVARQWPKLLWQP